MRYDPNIPPVASEWLALRETDRIAVCERYHRRVRPKPPRIKAHAVIHATIETQLAKGIESVVVALNRLQADGLDRHESIHAIGTVLIERLSEVQLADGRYDDPVYWYYQALDRLTVDSWRSKFSPSRDATDTR